MAEGNVEVQGAHGSWRWCAVVALLLHVAWFAPGIVDGSLRNLDVAGILYNARLVLQGELPYVASWEPKPPGAFFLLAPAMATGSVSAVWALALVWGTATSLAVGLLAERLWGRRLFAPAVLLHAAGVGIPIDADINYAFWATLPFVAAAAVAFKPAASVARPRAHWLLVGALAATAVIVKQSSVGLVLVLPLAVYLCAGPAWAPRFRAAAFGTLGAALAFAALALPYLVAGEGEALLVGLGLRGGWWVEYAASSSTVSGGFLSALGAGTWSIVDALPVGAAGVLLGAIRPPPRDAPRDNGFAGVGPREGWTSALVFLVASFAGVAIAMKFYTHHLAQLWPAMVVLAVQPWGWLARGVERLARIGVGRIVAYLALGLGGTAACLGLVRNHSRYLAAVDDDVRGLCASVAPHLPAGEPILAWGWDSWGVYVHCDRRAPGPIYKELTIVTSPNTNTAWQGFAPMVSRPGPAMDRYLADFAAHPPALLLWSPYYVRAGGDPLRDFTGITEALATRYRPLKLRSGLVAYLREDVARALVGEEPHESGRSPADRQESAQRSR